jgi:hypothetical protein
VFDGRKAKKKEYKHAHYKLTRFAEYPCRLTFVTPLPASTVPLRFVPCTVSMTPAVPHVAQASSVAPRMATPTLAAPSATATPHAATDVTTS